MLLCALQLDGLSSDFSLALDQVVNFHPLAIVDALLRDIRVLGDVACHYAANLAFMLKMTNSSFDWKFRPLFLRSTTDHHAERLDAFRELCAFIGLDAAPLMASISVVATPSAELHVYPYQ